MPAETCHVCKEVIQGKLLTALDRNYHPEHFTCQLCKNQIKGDKFKVRENEPLCQDCHDKNFSKSCYACKKPIQGRVVTAIGQTWHEDHFVCETCKQPLSGKTFFEKNEKPYCAEDYHAQFSPRCEACQQPITDRAIIAVDKNWHQDCFKCSNCKKVLGDESFYIKAGNVVCGSCSA